jgi:hypothetical protein
LATLAKAPDLCSSRFRRAVVAERDRLLSRLDHTQRAVGQHRERLASAEEEEGGLQARIALLTALLGNEPSPPNAKEATTAAARHLHGRAIREVAVRVLLWRQPSPGEAIHYRDWLSLLERAGYEVAGKRPDAVFLSQVTRSPVVKATTKAGHYEIDVDAPTRLTAEVARLQASLSAAADEDEGTGPVKPAASQTREVLLSIARAQRALDEAEDALRDAPGRTARSSSAPPLAG